MEQKQATSPEGQARAGGDELCEGIGGWSSGGDTWFCALEGEGRACGRGRGRGLGGLEVLVFEMVWFEEVGGEEAM